MLIKGKILSTRRKALVCSEIRYIEKGGKQELISTDNPHLNT
jgi:hypothetical protein